VAVRVKWEEHFQIEIGGVSQTKGKIRKKGAINAFDTPGYYLISDNNWIKNFS
jgi:hypothetical protein